MGHRAWGMGEESWQRAASSRQKKTDYSVGAASSRNSNDFYDFYGFCDFYDLGICRILESSNDYWLLAPIFLFIVICYLEFLVTRGLSRTGPVLAMSGIIA
jgi:hypothetical protein